MNLTLRLRIDDTVAVTSAFGSFYTGSGAGAASEFSRCFLNLSGASIRSFNTLIYLAIGDFVEVWGAVSGTAPYFAYTSAAYGCSFSGALVRAA